MVDTSHTPNGLRLCLSCLGSLLLLAGCGAKNYKADADEKVYDIIDAKWESQFGPKTNYRVSDVTPAPDSIRVEKAIPASGILTLPHALTLATVHNREYQTQKELLYTTALELRLVRHAYETQLFGGGSASYLTGGQDEAVRTAANIGFNRLLATGTQIGVRVATAWVDVLSGVGDRGFTSIFSGILTQPLLRGSDPMVVLENLTQAERDTLYQIRTFNRFRKTFAVAVASQYFQALELYDVIGNTRQYLDALVALHSHVVKLADAGLLAKIEADRIQQEILKARDTLILAQKEYELFLDELKITLALPMTAEFQMDVGFLDDLKARGIPYPELALDEVVGAALLRRLDIANGSDAVLDAQRAVYVAADSLRADLRITGALDINSRGDRTVTAGPQLDLPLDRVPEQTVYRQALITLQQRRRDYDLLADTIQLEVRQAHRKLVETAERYKVLSEQQELAQTRLRTTSALLKYARASSRRVLSAQQDLLEAQNEATDALVDYVVATLNFYRDAGVLQVRPDGIWQTGILDMPAARDGPTVGGLSTAK